MNFFTPATNSSISPLFNVSLSERHQPSFEGYQVIFTEMCGPAIISTRVVSELPAKEYLPSHFVKGKAAGSSLVSKACLGIGMGWALFILWAA